MQQNTCIRYTLRTLRLWQMPVLLVVSAYGQGMISKGGGPAAAAQQYGLSLYLSVLVICV